MPQTKMKLRFSATPGGFLHVGQARIALVAWLLARRHDGNFLLRLDDADPERIKPGAAEAIAQDLHWLGLDWDDQVAQSGRAARYEAAIAALQASGRLYPCFESDEELTAKFQLRLRRGLSTLYDRAMLKLTPAQRAAAEAGGKRPYWRFQLQPAPAEWGDMVLGRTAVKLTAISDPILVRADGTPLPLLTGAVDDLEFGITHAVRGEDQITNTGIQLDIMAALGAPPSNRAGAMRFAHLPLLLGADGGKLKRTGALTLRSLRADGIEPTALAAYLASLGTRSNAVPAPLATLAASFDLSSIAKAQPRFDPAALLTLNRRAIGATPFEAAREHLPPAATPAFWSAIRGSLDLLREARGWWDVVAGSIVPPLIDGEADFLHQALDLLPPEPWDDTTWPGWTRTLRAATGRKGQALLLPLRLALTGEDHGPELRDLLPLMGRARVETRLRLAAT